MKKLKLLIFLLLPLGVLADIRLPEIFGNGMVLQQQSEVNVWGWASPAEKIFIKGSWNNVMDSTIATSGALWSLKIKTPAAGGPYALTI